MASHNSFEHFLESFVKIASAKSQQALKAHWILETTGSQDAADLFAALTEEVRLLYHDHSAFKQLLKWNQEKKIKDPLLQRQLNVLLRAFKQNSADKPLLSLLSKKEAELMQTYAQFRSEIDGEAVSENDIRTILRQEKTPVKRVKAWAASKEIGNALAPKTLELVNIRNKIARGIGYNDYFKMQLDLQEVNEERLFSLLDTLFEKSEDTYQKIINDIEENQSRKFKVPKNKLGPWAWCEPFCQEDPLATQELDSLVHGVDISQISVQFYKKMGINIVPILEKSDMWERPGKNQHAFCTNIDRNKDIRTLNNVKSSIKWLETVLHEFGHAIYEMAYDSNLPWLLKEPPHMITTEAMALLAGRQAYSSPTLYTMLEVSAKHSNHARESLRRRQLIFSRWVLVMSHFEREMYNNPNQDLNALWWSLVKKYQKIKPPKNRESKHDWAAKYHISLAPVYYFSYLLGELFASAIEDKIEKITGTRDIASKKAGKFLQEKLFFPGNTLNWEKLIHNVLGTDLTPDPWLSQFVFKKS